jgi:hypothetical protein
LRREVWLVRVTFNSEILLMTGELMVVMRSRMEAANKRKVPTWWKIPVLAILELLIGWFEKDGRWCCLGVGGEVNTSEVVDGEAEMVGNGVIWREKIFGKGRE